MRPLREWIGGAEPPQESGPVEPLAVLAALVRSEPVFDPDEVFDCALFGLDAAEVRALGPIAPHLCEVAWEALEASGIPLEGLSGRRIGTWVGAPGVPPWSGREASAVCDVLGLPGPAVVVVEAGASALTALHLAASALRADDVDIALVLGDHGSGGVGAAVLGRVEQATPGQWRVRSLLLGSAVAQPGEGRSARDVAALRSGVEPDDVVGVDNAELGGLVDLVRAHESGDGRTAVVGGAGETVTVAAVLAAPEQTSTSEIESVLAGLSARSAPALRSLARGAAERLRSDLDLAGLASDGFTRPAFEHRLALPVRVGAVAARKRIRAWLAGESDVLAVGRTGSAQVAFVVPPAGAQMVNVAGQLYGEDEVFREALNRCDRALRPSMPRPLLSALFPSPGRELPVDDPVFANPLTVALAWSLAEMFRARGVVPHAVLGCGVGELAAGAIAGAVELEPALRLSAERGRLLRTVEAECSRVVVGATEEKLADLIVAVDGVDVVAVPMPGRVVIGGEPEQVELVLEQVRAQKLRYERMAGHPAHTPLVDRILGEFEELAAALEPLDPSTWSAAWVSSATGRRVESAPEADHWGATLRAPMRFAVGTDTLYEVGCRSFVELAARPTMAGAGAATLAELPVAWLSALMPEVDDLVQVDEVLARLWVRGVEVDRGVLSRPPGAAELPSYPWDRRPLGQGVADGEQETEQVPPSRGPAPASEPWLPDLPEEMPLDEPTLVPADEVPAPPPPVVADDLSVEGSVGMIDALDVPEPVTWKNTPGPAADRDLLSLEPPRQVAARGEEDEDEDEALEEVSMVELTLDDLPPASALSESTAEREPTDDLLEEMEDMEVEAYSGRAVPLQEAEQRADIDATWNEAWEPYPLPDARAEGEPATWLILADSEGVGDYISALLTQQHHQCVRVLHEQPYPRDDGTLFVPDPAAEGAWNGVLEALGTLHGAVRVLHLWTLDVLDDADADPLAGWASVLQLVKELQALGLPVRLQLVTRGAAYEPDASLAYHGGALWGAGRLVAVEVPAVFGGLVDLDPGDEDPDELLDHLLAEAPDNPSVEVAFRGDQRLRRVVTRTEGLPAETQLDAEGAWLLGGDVDGPLLELAGWLADRGVKRVFLVSPDAPPADVLRGVLDLQRKGVMCIIVRADVSEERDREQLEQRIRGARLAGVVLRDAAAPVTLKDLEPGEAASLWTREIGIARALEELAGDVPFWVWSEGRAMSPGMGAGVSAVTGAALDAAARARLAAGRPTTVIHAAPAGSLRQGQAVRLVGRLGPVGGIFGIWKG